VETLLHAGLSNAVSATFLALVVASLGRVLARRPAVLHCLWLLVLLKLVTPPLYEVPIPWPKPFTEVPEPARPLHFVPFERMAGIGDDVPAVAGAIAQTEVPAEELILELIPVADRISAGSQSRPAIDSLTPWLTAHGMPLVAMIWLAGTVPVLVLSAKRVWQFQRLLREARPAGEDTQEWVNKLSMSLGLLRPPSVWWIGGKLSPLVWALGLRPRLIIPTDLWKSLDDHQRSTLIVHELAHLRRGDHRVRIFELIVTALFWWHPVLWWVRQALRDVEEQCCDAWVVWAFPESAKSYAETLLETLDFLNQSDRSVPLLASGFGKVHHLRKRLTMIMSGTTPRLVGVRGALIAAGMAALLLPVNATWAQKPDQNKEVRIIVKSDDDSPRSADTVARFAGDTPKIITEDIINLDDMVVNVGELALTPQDTKDPTSVRLEIKTDDSSVAVTADSMEQALAKLKDQIKSLVAKLPRSDQDKTKIALERVVQELESQIKATKGGQPRVVTLNRVLRSADTADAKISPEKKAEIDKARSKVKELTRSLQANQLKLAEAQSKLSELEGAHHPANVRVRAVVRGVVTGIARSPDLPTVSPGDGFVVSEEVRLNNKPADKPAEQHRRGSQVRGYDMRRIDDKKAGEVDQGRLEELEKKLQKLLEEVASLKKDRGK